jgi:hypothetical protein
MSSSRSNSKIISSKDNGKNSAANLTNRRKKYAFRQDSMGYSADDHHANDVNVTSLTYLDDESEAYRAYNASNHYYHRGTYWNEGKREVIVRYFHLAMIGLVQGSVAYFTNFFSHLFIEVSKGNWIYILDIPEQDAAKNKFPDSKLMLFLQQSKQINT